MLGRTKHPYLGTILKLDLAKYPVEVNLRRFNGLLFQLKVLSNVFPKYMLAVFTYHKRVVTAQ